MATESDNACNPRPVPPIPSPSPGPIICSDGEIRRVDDQRPQRSAAAGPPVPSKQIPPLPRDPVSLPPVNHVIPPPGLEAHLRRVEQELHEEKQRHQQTIFKLQQKQQEAEKHHRHWRESVNELNRFMRQSQGVNQLTDPELEGRVKQLRIAVRDFAILHFEHELKDTRMTQASHKLIKKYIVLPKNVLEAYLQSPSTRSILVKSFLWTYLLEEVFERFRWAPPVAARAVTDIYGFFDPLRAQGVDTIPDLPRRVQAWKANTSTLVLNMMGLDNGKPSDNGRDFAAVEARYLAKELALFSLSKSKDIENQLVGIIARGLDLDEELNTQLASITWTCLKKTLVCPFNPELMELDSSHTPARNDQTVQLLLAPGLIKRGKSSGDRFDETTIILKMEVTSDPHPKDIFADGLRPSSSRAYWWDKLSK
ncbi:hypothetical protein BJX99DRAFT_260245 [Aspergillus californicus]